MAKRRDFPRSSWLCVAAIAGAIGCYPQDNGKDPPLDRFYFPVSVAVGPDREDGTGPSRLYVTNSDFDLQYNAGSLQAYDLDRLRELLPRYCDRDSDCTGGYVCDVPTLESTKPPTHVCVDPADPKPCGELGEQSAGESLVTPGRCNFVDPTSPPGGGPSLLVQSVSIGAFATDALYRVNPTDASGRTGRLFVPVRGDSTLHWIDVNEDGDGTDSLDCGQGSGLSCDSNHRRGSDAALENSRGLTLPVEPFGIAANELGTALVLTHQTTGSVSLFVNRWALGEGALDGPNLADVRSGLPSGAMGVASIPESRFVIESPPGTVQYQPGFLVTFRTAPQLQLVRYYSSIELTGQGGIPQQLDPQAPFLETSRSVPVTTNSSGFDSRGIAVDARRRRACESRCGDSAERPECLKRCVRTPLEVYIANRSPPSMIVGVSVPNSTEPGSDDLPTFNDSIPLGQGASRVYTGSVLGKDGTPEPRVFVICFDTKLIYIYDPASGVETTINTGRGPHSLAIDAARGLGYVGHFLDSYVGVIDLNKAHKASYGKMILTLGQPAPPRAAK
jgi:hypothetical protein